MKKSITALFAALLCACGQPPESPYVSDQCLRAEIFQRCLKDLPSGPLATKYNDWDEVVDSCENAAYYQSKREREVVKPECRL